MGRPPTRVRRSTAGASLPEPLLVDSQPAAAAASTDRPPPQRTGAAPFVDRHVGVSSAAERTMLEVVGQPDLQALVARAVPESIRMTGALRLDAGRSEPEVTQELRRLAGRNRVLASMIGLGYYGTHVPAVIRRGVLENPAWYTAYTPYQPEISQGRLEALLNFQTVVRDLTGLATANASLLDEATAAAEAMTLMRRASKVPAGAVLVVDADVLPQTRAVIATRAEPLGIGVVEVDLLSAVAQGADALAEVLDRAAGETGVFGVVVQYPGTSGRVVDLAPVAAAAHERGALLAACADLLALTLLTPPGELGADVAVGTSQRFGVPMGFGGPHAGYMAVRAGLERSLPGRLVGVSVDADGDPAYRLALQTREQHIRREKATSNICTAQVLLAVMASMYAAYHGPDGLTAIASRVHERARAVAGIGQPVHEAFFDTVQLRTPGRAAAVVEAALDEGINLRLVDRDTVAIACDETTTEEHVAALRQILDGGDASAGSIPGDLRRDDQFLTHPVFHQHHSETAMLRYLRRLADKDVALDRSMIPLGSCTMTLNAPAEMEPITWPGFAGIHPFAPLDQAEGYLELIHELEQWLCDITGYDAVSLQPNAGSQGELAGLLAIREWHRSRGDLDRNICLIPQSAHGTNAASAAMANMRVVVVACDDAGNVDLDDLRAKLNEHGSAIAALMVTYPSTHGVFEESISDVCAALHDAGGQVYVDGANLNALVGLALPGRFGADVSHLNLHKTFCIPHGGGGPGVGPVAVRSHLAPFLPNHPLVPEAGPATGP